MKKRETKRSGRRKKKSSRLRKYAILVGFLLLTGIGFWNAGRFLDYSQQPRQADAIIVLSGGGGRVQEAARLYEQGYARYMVFSNATEGGDPPRRGNMRETALALGVPDEAILTEREADSTLDNAAFTLPIMQSAGLKSAIVVSSDFHMRRVQYLFEREYRDSGITLTYIGSDSGYRPDGWWKDPYSRRTTVREYAKFIGNTFGYHGREAKRTFDRILDRLAGL